MTFAWMRRLMTVLGTLAFTVLLFEPLASPAAAEDAVSFPYCAVVTGDDVLVRCGADFGFYAIGRLKTADVVKVIGERNGFGRVALVGPSFTDYFGYVKYPRAQTARVRIEADEKTGVTLGRVDVIGPNLQFNNDPAQSWKSLLRLPAEERLTVLQTTETDREVVHKIMLPPASEAWISMNHIRPATPDECASFEKVIAKAPAPAPGTAPAQTEGPAVLANPTTIGVNEPATGAVVLAHDEPAIAPVTEPGASTGAISTPAPGDQTSTAAPAAASRTGASQEAIAAQRVKQVSLADLEEIYKRLAKQPTETSEIQPLREQYLAFAERNTQKPSQSRFATARARQLEIWLEAQQRSVDLADLHTRAKLADQVVQETIMANEARREYIAIGLLEASTIYDGERLPKLLRLQDVSTGRTIAYLYPEHDDTSLLTMLGELVGIVGEKTYDGGLRLNVITPRRIDLLTPHVPN